VPFTLSHPAAVLLLSRPPLVASALVAGTMAPDLPYVLPQATSADWGPYSDFNLTYTHELGSGMIAGTLVALLLLVLYHQLLKRPLLALLPDAAAGRLIEVADRFRWTAARRAAWIIVSAVTGVLTHLIWDALVHENGFAGWSPWPEPFTPWPRFARWRSAACQASRWACWSTPCCGTSGTAHVHGRRPRPVRGRRS
jgi:hypothetical protein